MRGKIKKEAGFTFIEVIVAMVIMMIGIIPLYSLFSSSLNNYNHSTKTTTALNLAEEIIEELGEKDLSKLVDDIDDDTDDDDTDDDIDVYNTGWKEITGSPGYEYKAEVKDVSYEIDDKTVEFYAIEVWVRWQVSNQAKEISLKNYSSGRRDDIEE